MDFGAVLIVVIVLATIGLSLVPTASTLVRIGALFLGTWNVNIRLHPEIVAPDGAAKVPNLDYPSRGFWKALGMFCTLRMFSLTLLSYIPEAYSQEFPASLLQGLIAIGALVTSAGYFFRISQA